MKKYLFAALLGLLIAIGIQLYFNGKCIHFQADRAIITLQGVYCFVDRVELVKPYMLLKELEEREQAAPTYDPRMKINFPTKQTMVTHDPV